MGVPMCPRSLYHILSWGGPSVLKTAVIDFVDCDSLHGFYVIILYLLFSLLTSRGTFLTFSIHASAYESSQRPRQGSRLEGGKGLNGAIDCRSDHLPRVLPARVVECRKQLLHHLPCLFLITKAKKRKRMFFIVNKHLFE